MTKRSTTRKSIRYPYVLLFIWLGFGLFFSRRRELEFASIFGTWRSPDGQYEYYIGHDEKGYLKDIGQHTQRTFTWTAARNLGDFTFTWDDDGSKSAFLLDVRDDNILEFTHPAKGNSWPTEGPFCSLRRVKK